MQRPEEVNLSREDGAALIERLEDNALTTDDRRVLVKLITFHFWLLLALQEAKLSLKRLRSLLFGEQPKKRTARPPDKAPGSSDGDGDTGAARAVDLTKTDGKSSQEAAGNRRSQHGRWGAEVYSGAVRVECRHEELAIGERCPVCGQGRLYRMEPGVEILIDGNALLSAVRYVLEKLRCSACGQVFTAPLPDGAGVEKYSARARAVLALCRYYLGVPLYRLQGYQSLLGVPVADATQWDHIERVADCAYPVFEHLQYLAAQGEVIYQDDTHVRILSPITENR
jgi:transposase